VDDAGQALGLMAPLEERGAEVDVVDVQRVIVEGHVHALAAARLARFPGELVLDMMAHRHAAEDDVAVDCRAHVPGGRHDPAHAERCAQLGGLPFAHRTGADDFLQGDDVGVDGGEDGRNACEPHPAVEPAAAVDVVGGHAHGAGPLRIIRRHGQQLTTSQ
jgi:hypothetical protein